MAAAVAASVVSDFYIKTTGRSKLFDGWKFLPLVDIDNDLLVRVLALNCLTHDYSKLWGQGFREDFKNSNWSKQNSSRLPSGYFLTLKKEWDFSSPVRSDYARRQFLLEIDVLVAQKIGITLPELQLIYRIQFPVMKQYEKDTWYDVNGRICFTNSKGLVGVGLARKRKAADADIVIVFPDSTSRLAEGWDEILELQMAGKLPHGSLVSTFLMDDTQPGGPVRRERKYVAPFALANREEDYRIAWEFFERKKAAEAKA